MSAQQYTDQTPLHPYQEQNTTNQNIVDQIPEQPATSQPTSTPEGAITQLGSSYQIKNTVSKKKEPKSFPTALLSLIIIGPIVALFIISAIGNKNANKSKGSFLFNTLESKYFTLNYDPGYTIDSVIDKKIPFLEKHELTNTQDGEKYLSIVIKDVKFNYTLDDNTTVKNLRENSKLYSEMPYELHAKQGLYFKKVDENFEHIILLVDRNNSLLYEITFRSPTGLAKDPQLEKEIKEVLNSMTFFVISSPTM